MAQLQNPAVPAIAISHIGPSPRSKTQIRRGPNSLVPRRLQRVEFPKVAS